MSLSVLRLFRRGEANFFLLAALLAVLAMPGFAANALPPGSGEAVLCWLQAETQAAAPIQRAASLLSLCAPQQIEPQKSEVSTPILSVATAHCGQFSSLVSPHQPLVLPDLPRVLAPHEAAQLAGVRTNSNLE